MKPTDGSFALCLTHDVDRTRKTYQALYYALTDRERSLYHLTSILPGRNPYWQFEEIMSLEDELGVRSAFYFLNEQRLLRDRPLRDLLSAEAWMLYGGRYSVEDSAVADIIRTLDDEGWEVGLHGSYESYQDFERLRREKETLESVLGHEVRGIRQHYLNLDVPRTWQYQSDLGFAYDASLGSSADYGFEHGYEPLRPFDDQFIVFPLTVMELTLPVRTDPETAWTECERLLEEARENEAVMTILWHPNYFSEADYPGYREFYRRIIERALEMDAWVGAPGELYEAIENTADPGYIRGATNRSVGGR